MIRLMRVEVLKLRSTRLWIGLFLGGVLLTAVGTIATLVLAGTPQGTKSGITPVRTVADVRDLVFTAHIMAVFALILGATSLTTEYRSGTVAGTFLATPNRWPVVAAKVVGSAIAGLAFGVLAGLVPVASAVVAFLVRGQHVALGWPVALGVLIVGVVCASSGAMGAGVGATIRSQLVAVLGVLAWSVIVEPLLGGLVSVTQKWLPFTGAQASIAQQTPGLLRPLPGAVLLVAYLAAAIAAGTIVTMRRDVG